MSNLYYTYVVGWSSLNKWYYGRRTSSKAHPKDLWITYFTSSKEVKAIQSIYGDPDVIQVRKTFTDKQNCIDWEIKVLRRLKVTESPKWLNISNGQRGVGGKPKGSKEKLSTRQKKSESQRGKVTIISNITSDRMRVSVEDGRYLVQQGTHRYQRSGAKDVPRTIEERQRQSETMKGSVPWNKGKVGVLPKIKGIPRPRCCCVICGKEVDVGNLHRHHKHTYSSESAID